MWLIEPEDAAMETPGQGGGGQGGEVVPGLLAGSYKFRSTDTRRLFVSFTRNGNDWYISADTDLKANKIKVEQKGNGVILYYSVNRLKIYISVNGSNQVVGVVNNDSYVWTIVPGAQSGQYFITASNGQVLSLPVSGGTGSAFTVEPQTQDARKLWQFVP
ncbi:hypothetical protein CPB84DRAFT_698192 [Gymnopilus junonius]|uniref:Uncharacterized protein n=1 Tax=Gymnopilus junonius TaxID=109634 RepID=A0A9P5NSU2_GYMJU|nr:hypothetical protein CPB84DRAFT_698192 [Gymnopilus junonius]